MSSAAGIPDTGEEVERAVAATSPTPRRTPPYLGRRRKVLACLGWTAVDTSTSVRLGIIGPTRTDRRCCRSSRRSQTRQDRRVAHVIAVEGLNASVFQRNLRTVHSPVPAVKCRPPGSTASGSELLKLTCPVSSDSRPPTGPPRKRVTVNRIRSSTRVACAAPIFPLAPVDVERLGTCPCEVPEVADNVYRMPAWKISQWRTSPRRSRPSPSPSPLKVPLPGLFGVYTQRHDVAVVGVTTLVARIQPGNGNRRLMVTPALRGRRLLTKEDASPRAGETFDRFDVAPVRVSRRPWPYV